MPWGRNAPWDGGGVRPGELVGSGLTLPQGKLAGNTAAAAGIEAIGIGPGLRLDETTKELSAVGETFDGVVQTWADLPVDGSVEVGALYIVRASSGTWLLNRKQRGLYQRIDDTGTRAADWQYLGEWLEEFSDANWSLYNASDSTKALKFALSGLSTGVVATLTVLGSATLNDWFNQSVKTGASPTFAGVSILPASGVTGLQITATNSGAIATFAGGGLADTGFYLTNTFTGGRSYYFGVAGSASGNIPGAGFYLYDVTGVGVVLAADANKRVNVYHDLSVTGTISASGNASFTAATPSTSRTTGALVVTGGIGMGGALSLADRINALANFDFRGAGDVYYTLAGSSHFRIREDDVGLVVLDVTEGAVSVIGTLTSDNVVTGASLRATAMPTSTSGQPSGTLWNDGGTVKIVP